LGVRRNFAGILPNLPEKYFKKVTSKNSLHVNSGAVFFQIKACWAPFWLRFTGSFRRFSEILPGFYGDFVRIFTKSKLWGEIAPPPPTSVHVIVTHYRPTVEKRSQVS